MYRLLLKNLQSLKALNNGRISSSNSSGLSCSPCRRSIVRLRTASQSIKHSSSRATCAETDDRLCDWTTRLQCVVRNCRCGFNLWAGVGDIKQKPAFFRIASDVLSVFLPLIIDDDDVGSKPSIIRRWRSRGACQVHCTPACMAPEQIDGLPGIDHRADIYSMGVVFHERLSGEQPVLLESSNQTPGR